MLRFFQSAHLSRYLFIITLAAIYWIPTFVVQTNYSGEQLPFFKTGLWLCGNNYFLLLTVAFVITLFSALAFNQICSESGITERISTLGGFLFIVLASSESFFTIMSPFISITFILLLLIKLLYAIPHANDKIPLAFNSGFLVSLASLCYSQTIFLILVIWIAFYIHRSANWRNFVVSFIGLATPILFLFVWYFWTDQLNVFVGLWHNLFKVGNASKIIELPYPDLTVLIGSLLLVIVAILKIFSGLREKSINLRRNLMITFYFFIVVLCMVFFSGQTEELQLFVIPSAIFLAHAFNKTSKQRIPNLVLTILLLLIFLNQYSKLMILF